MLLRKKLKKTMEYGFFKLAIHKNTHHARKIIARYLSSILKFKMKNNEVHAWGKLKSNRLRYRGLVNFLKLLKVIENNKKRSTLYHLKFQTKGERKIESQKSVKAMNFKDSRVSISSKKSANQNRSLDLAGKSASTSRVNVNRKI